MMFLLRAVQRKGKNANISTIRHFVFVQKTKVPFGGGVRCTRAPANVAIRAWYLFGRAEETNPMNTICVSHKMIN
jgi:hypothetical protein